MSAFVVAAGTIAAAKLEVHTVERRAARPSLRRALERVLQGECPGARIVSIRELASDADISAATLKATGYGAVFRITVRTVSGAERGFVLHFVTANGYGHERRSDRAQALLLAFDSYATVPEHVRAIDVGFVHDGRMISLADAGEPYLVTEWAEGRPYADDLRAIAARGRTDAHDRDRVFALARCLAQLHVPVDRPAGVYERSVRDLLGHGEGIFGIVDGYASDVPAAPLERLRAIERACLEWRWRLKQSSRALCRTHGDFHPFNVLFDEAGRVTLLDSSRGSVGDPADDVAAMAINYLFFALEARASWPAFERLWRDFFGHYLELSHDVGLFSVIAPFFAWRALVLASPRWYPRLAPASRDLLLTFAERALGRARFDPELAGELMR